VDALQFVNKRTLATPLEK